MENPAAVLAAHLDLLKLPDQEFAKSLLGQLAAKGKLSDKQLYWLNKLAVRANGLAGGQGGTDGDLLTLDVGGFTGVAQMLTKPKALGKLKRPKITFRLACGQELVLTLASHAAKVPGAVNLSDGKPFGQNTWFGRVTREGAWQLGPKVTDEVVLDQICDLLVQLAADPAATVAAHGRRTGRCCFCNKPLDDPASTAAGYGPVCAKKWGLPWGGPT